MEFWAAPNIRDNQGGQRKPLLWPPESTKIQDWIEKEQDPAKWMVDSHEFWATGLRLLFVVSKLRSPMAPIWEAFRIRWGRDKVFPFSKSEKHGFCFAKRIWLTYWGKNFTTRRLNPSRILGLFRWILTFRTPMMCLRLLGLSSLSFLFLLPCPVRLWLDRLKLWVGEEHNKSTTFTSSGTFILTIYISCSFIYLV